MFKDKSFKQFAVIDDDVKLYADGTYEFKDGGNL